MPLVGSDLSSLLFINPTAAGIHRSDPHCHWFMCCNADHWLDCWVEDGRNESWELNCCLPSFANIILRLMYRTEIWLFGEYTLRELPPINMNEQFPCSEYTIQQPSLQMEVHLSVVTHKCQYTPQKIYQKHFDVLRRFNTELLHITYVTYNIFIIDGHWRSNSSSVTDAFKRRFWWLKLGRDPKTTKLCKQFSLQLSLWL